MHLDAGASSIPEGNMPKLVHSEAAAEFTINSDQHILVESGSHSLGIIVSSVQQPGSLDQVKSQQKSIAGAQRFAHVSQEFQGLVRLEVSNGRANQQDQFAPIQQ